VPDISEREEKAIADLGGAKAAAGRLALYVNLHRKFAPHKDMAIYFMGRCGRHAVPGLAAVLEDPGRSELHRSAAGALKRIGPEAAAAVPALTRALASGDSEVCADAAETLSLVGQPAWPAAPALRQALTKGTPAVQWRAAAALGAIGPSAASASEELAAWLSSSHADADLRAAAAEALSKVGAPARLAVPALTAALADSSQSVRFAAAVSLAAYGPEAAPAEAALRKLAADGAEAPDVRWAAAEALKRLDNDYGSPQRTRRHAEELMRDSNPLRSSAPSAVK
jgi:HEAT repeat protein